MQEEVNDKTIGLCVKGGKITASILKAALTKLLKEMEEKRQSLLKKQTATKTTETIYKGKQTMEQLKGKGSELSNIEITDGNIKSFEKYARKYSVDFCLKKDTQSEPPKYYVFFKAKDVDQMTAAFREYTGATLNKKKERPSIRKKLSKAIEKAAKHRERAKVRDKVKDQTL